MRRSVSGAQGGWVAGVSGKDVVTVQQRKSYLICSLVLGLLFISAIPASAASKSATIKVSCTVLPLIQISSMPSPQSFSPETDAQPGQPPERQELALTGLDSGIYVQTNLGNNYSMIETLLKEPTPIKLYSITAL